MFTTPEWRRLHLHFVAKEYASLPGQKQEKHITLSFFFHHATSQGKWRVIDAPSLTSRVPSWPQLSWSSRISRAPSCTSQLPRSLKPSSSLQRECDAVLSRPVSAWFVSLPRCNHHRRAILHRPPLVLCPALHPGPSSAASWSPCYTSFPSFSQILLFGLRHLPGCLVLLILPKHSPRAQLCLHKANHANHLSSSPLTDHQPCCRPTCHHFPVPGK